MNDSEFIDETELCRRLTLCRRTVCNLRKKGVIPFVKLGGKVRGRVLFHWPSVEKALLRIQTGTAE